LNLRRREEKEERGRIHGISREKKRFHRDRPTDRRKKKKKKKKKKKNALFEFTLSDVFSRQSILPFEIN